MTIKQAVEQVQGEVRKVVLGQDETVEYLFTALVAGGHVLLEGVPGIAKTLLSRAVARAVEAEFARIQCTPDLMPADVTGTNVFDLQERSFRLVKGPVFTNLLLVDEINRTPPKTQSAFLEAMQERTVTIDGLDHHLPGLFCVLATQNPVEYEGTYPLPEAQLDRFLMKVLVSYPEAAIEQDILRLHLQGRDPQDLESGRRQGGDRAGRFRGGGARVGGGDGARRSVNLSARAGASDAGIAAHAARSQPRGGGAAAVRAGAGRDTGAEFRDSRRRAGDGASGASPSPHSQAGGRN